MTTQIATQNIGRYPLPWSICDTVDDTSVRDANGTMVANITSDAEFDLWEGIVLWVNQRAFSDVVSYGLTALQTRCLALIEQGIEIGICPTYQELAQAMGAKSKSRVHEIVGALEARKRIRKLPGHPRSIVVLIPLTDQERKACHPSRKP